VEIAGIDHPYLGFVSRSNLLGVSTVEPGRRKTRVSIRKLRSRTLSPLAPPAPEPLLDRAPEL
jgi:hypothetical protein